MWLYRLTNKTNGKAYIGTSVHPISYRLSRHRYDAKRGRKDMAISQAIKRYGFDSFSTETLVECDNYEALLMMEANAIAAFNTRIPHGYNVTAGGMGSRRACSQETRDRISAKAKGRKPWNYGKRNAATIARYARVGHIAPPPPPNPWPLGKKRGLMPEQHRQTISETMRRVRATRFWSTKKQTSLSGGV